jgi:hypothetical protein
VAAVRGRWGGAVLSQVDPHQRTIWTLGIAAGKRLRLGLGASVLRRHLKVRDFTDDHRGFGSSLALGWHEHKGYLLVSASGLRERRSLSMRLAVYDQPPFFAVDGSGWGPFSPRLEVRTAWIWQRVTCAVTGRWAESRAPISTVELLRESAKGRGEIGNPVLRDNFLGLLVSGPAGRGFRVFAAGWAYRWDVVTDRVDVSFARSLLHHSGYRAGLGVELRLGSAFILRAGSSAGWWHDRESTDSIGLTEDGTLGAEREATDPSGWRHDFAFGLGFDDHGVRVDTRIRTDRFNVLRPFTATDITISW